MNKFYAVSILLLLLSLSVGANECGRPLGKDFLLETERIVSGYDIGYYRYPWFAVLLHHGSVGCGGALIGPRTVLTAAHCYGDFLTSPQQINLEQIYTIKLGVYNICTPETTETEYKIEKVHVHELYLEKKPYYDISLVILSNDTKDFQSICLPNKAITKRPKEATVPGLGTLRFKGAMPCTVHEARILIYSDNECRAMIHRTGNNGTQLQNAFCAGYLQGGIDTCQGDSGGPLQVITKNGDYFLLGIVSYGFKCALPGLLGVYTDVSQYLNWIETKSGIKPTNSYSNSTNLSKPTHLQPYWKPVNVIIVINDKIMTVRKNVLHRPIASKLNT